jgi:hypothetical protein
MLAETAPKERRERVFLVARQVERVNLRLELRFALPPPS